MPPTLGYWDIRGRGEPIRLLLHYLGIPFENREYKIESAEEEWFSRKSTMGFDFPNLPYYIDGNLRLTQSAAILEYIASKYGLVPDCIKRRAKLSMVMNEITDLNHGFALVCFNPEFEKVRVGYLEQLPSKLENFERYLEDKPWVSGENISYPDFGLYEFLSKTQKFEPTSLDNFPNLKAYMSRFENLPDIKEYMSTEEFKKRPYMPLVSHWRGD